MNFFGEAIQHSLRKPQPTSAARIKIFTPESVAALFDVFEKEMMKKKFRILCSLSCEIGELMASTVHCNTDRSEWFSQKQEYFQLL
jgi:hypothetical protein